MNSLAIRLQPRTYSRGLARDERGLSTVEYVIILVVIAVAAIQMWKTFGTTVSTKVTDSNGKIENL